MPKMYDFHCSNAKDMNPLYDHTNVILMVVLYEGFYCNDAALGPTKDRSGVFRSDVLWIDQNAAVVDTTASDCDGHTEESRFVVIGRAQTQQGDTRAK